jgi:hypothetical protein
LDQLANEAMERDTELRNAWFRNLHQFKGNQMVFIDETGINVTNGRRAYGRAFKGDLAIKKVATRSSINLSVLPAFSVDGYIACNVYKGGVTADLFERFIEEDVLPKCNPWPGPRSVIVMDNAKIHCCDNELDYALENYGLDDEQRAEFKTVIWTNGINVNIIES